MGEFDHHEVPAAIQQLQSPTARRNFALSGMSHRNDVANEVAREAMRESLDSERGTVLDEQAPSGA